MSDVKNWIFGRFQGMNLLYLLFISALVGYILVLMTGGEIPTGDGTSWAVYRQSVANTLTNLPTTLTKSRAGTQAATDKVVDSMNEMRDKIDYFDKDHIAIRTGFDEMSNEFTEIKKTLPELIVVRHNSEDNKYELLDHFWDALNSRVSSEYDKGNIPWSDWVKRNSDMIDTITKSRLDKHFDSAMHAALSNYRVITRDAVMDMMKEYKQKFDSIDLNREAVVTELAHKAMNEHLSTLQMAFTEGAWTHKYLENARTALAQVNFFSPKLGAVVDPNLTSPTMRKDEKTFKKWLYKALTWTQLPNPPVTALTRWEEMGDCWCAPMSKKENVPGKAQIAVIMPYPVFPQSLVVEHIPEAATLDIASAPKDVEMWVRVPDPEARDAVEAAYDATSFGMTCGPRVELDGSYVCAGKWWYRKDGPNHVQAFKTDIDFVSLGISVQKAVVRVTSSWGREWTCLYRLRLVGQVAVDLFEKTSD